MNTKSSIKALLRSSLGQSPSKHSPPKVALKVLGWLSGGDPILLGDFDEIYRSRSATRRKLYCKFWAYSQVLKSVYPLIKHTIFNRSRSEILIAVGLIMAALSAPLTLFLMGAAPDTEYLRNANDDAYAVMLIVTLLAVAAEAGFVIWCGLMVVSLFEESYELSITKLWLVPALVLLGTACGSGYLLWTSGRLTSLWYRIVFLEVIGPWLGLTAFAIVLSFVVIDKCFGPKPIVRSRSV